MIFLVLNRKSEHHYLILQLVEVPNFSLNRQIRFFRSNLPEIRKIALLRASMVVTYYIKLFRTGANRHNGILMSLVHLVAEVKRSSTKDVFLGIFQNFQNSSFTNIH